MAGSAVVYLPLCLILCLSLFLCLTRCATWGKAYPAVVCSARFMLLASI